MDSKSLSNPEMFILKHLLHMRKHNLITGTGTGFYTTLYNQIRTALSLTSHTSSGQGQRGLREKKERKKKRREREKLIPGRQNSRVTKSGPWVGGGGGCSG